ncbi:Hypothetical protein POVR1_LOCUS590 [uncultured virus]|nr:Hypothetical protein POVR1_LOCUS590 [uncultured virus]
MSIDRLKAMGFDHYELGKSDPEYYLKTRATRDGKRSYKVLDRELRYDDLAKSSQEFIKRLYGTKDAYIYSCFDARFDGYGFLEDAIYLYDSALVNTSSAYLVIKKLDGGYLDEVYDPTIAAHDLIDKVLNDNELIKTFTKIRYTF